MFVGPFIFILESVAQFFIMLFLLRFLMQVVRVSFQQPMGQFVVKMTNWLVLRLRKVIPGLLGYDLASLVGGFLIAVLSHALVFAVTPSILHFNSPLVWLGLGLFGLLELIRVTLYCLIGAVIVQAILSWTNPHHPISGTVNKLTAPLLRPFQRLIPPISGVDLSPLVLLLILNVLLRYPLFYVNVMLVNLLTYGA